jgi:signal transduction histidine kinase
MTQPSQPSPEPVPHQGGGGPADRAAAIAAEAGRIGHDLNNCLGVIVGRTELARMHLERGNVEGVLKGLEVILGQTDRMRQLADELRAFRQRV